MSARRYRLRVVVAPRQRWGHTIHFSRHMPLIRIDVIEGRSDTELAAIGDAVHTALVECFGIPQRDRFQVIAQHRRGGLIYDPAYLEIDRSDGFVLVQVFCAVGRTQETKQAFYERAARGIVASGKTRLEDVMITLVENNREDWSFGKGVAQYLTLPKDRWH